MPSFCAVVNCGSRAERDRLSFFRFPAIIKNRGGIIEKLSTKRREKWINALKRGPLSDTKLKNGRICSKHFISGKPAELYNENDADWVPCQNLGYEFGQEIRKPDSRYLCRHKYRKRVESVPQERTSYESRPSEPATQNATQGNSSHIEQLHIKEEPLEADPSDYRLYQQLRDSIKTEPVNSETDSTNGDPEKHTDSISTDKEHLVNVKKEYSDSSDNEISVNHETEQIPMFESVFVKAEPFEEELPL